LWTNERSYLEQTEDEDDTRGAWELGQDPFPIHGTFARLLVDESFKARPGRRMIGSNLCKRHMELDGGIWHRIP
jgi:hypothetical protein